ncbi:hypothetical protein BC831DRAFT_446313 [Entophlyctis helioformis]|nr:hypothetical protein BC831DRAFT_446313 [Entophlyctis helioformis]
MLQPDGDLGREGADDCCFTTSLFASRESSNDPPPIQQLNVALALVSDSPIAASQLHAILQFPSDLSLSLVSSPVGSSSASPPDHQVSCQWQPSTQEDDQQQTIVCSGNSLSGMAASFQLVDASVAIEPSRVVTSAHIAVTDGQDTVLLACSFQAQCALANAEAPIHDDASVRRVGHDLVNTAASVSGAAPSLSRALLTNEPSPLASASASISATPGLRLEVVVGSFIGAAVCLGLVAFLVYWCIHTRRGKRKQPPLHPLSERRHIISIPATEVAQRHSVSLGVFSDTALQRIAPSANTLDMVSEQGKPLHHTQQ